MDKSHYNKKTGDYGENLAANYLEQKGYRILERNFRIGKGEVDIVAKDEDTLAFIEVKTCTVSNFGEPETWVTRRKQKQIGKIASGYLQKHDLQDVDCRFDVVAITFKKDQAHIHLIKDAFWL